jgi:hypothetical protein
MLQGLMGKIMAGLLAASALVFSPTKGNNPQFEPLQSRAGHNYLLVTAKLVNAFDNDFGDVFNCGKPVNLWYKITVRQDKNTVWSSNYRHTVRFDPMNVTWELYTAETNSKKIHTVYKDLVEGISLLECTIPRDIHWKSVEITAEAWLQPIELSQAHRTADLMVLWRFKRPTARLAITLPPIS